MVKNMLKILTKYAQKYAIIMNSRIVNKQINVDLVRVKMLIIERNLS